MGILFVPLFDTLRVFLLRMMAGRSPFSPDKNHIHHRILAMGFQQISTVMLLGFAQHYGNSVCHQFCGPRQYVLIAALVAFSVLLSVFLGVYQSRTAQQRVAS